MSEKRRDLSNLSEEDLLNIRICELSLKIEGTWLENCVKELYKELNSKGIKFKPECYLADEWLTPDGEPIVGIPFFLAHPELMKLEKKMMLDVEGGTKAWCMKLLRHETGHALNYAYKLYRKKRWRDIFGKFSQEYGDTYRFRPYSKRFVRHLEDYYAQYHPDEDFAETFAVWLTPGSDWENKYKGWKAISKLRYVDEVMQEIKDKEPIVKKGKKYWQFSSLRGTLKNFYKKKRQSYAEEFPDFHDTNLKRIFSSNKKNKKAVKASDLIKTHRKGILNSVSAWTGEKKYITDELVKTLIERCRDLGLVVEEPQDEAVIKITTYVTALIMNYIYTGGFSKE